MKESTYKNVSYSIIGIFLVVVIILVFITLDATLEPKSWLFFDLDFSEKDNVIASYGGLLSALLSFITILFLILDISYQRRNKSLEEEQHKRIKIQEFHDNLNIITLFIDELKKDTLEMHKGASEFVKHEKNQPDEMNRMQFLPNTYPKLILDVDRNRFYNAIKHFEPSEDWNKLYIDLYKIVDYYDKSFAELSQKHQLHLDKKFKHSRELAIALDDLIDKNSEIRNAIINDAKGNKDIVDNNPFYPILYFIQSKAIEITKRKVVDEERISKDFVNPTSFTVWHNEVLQPAFKDILDLWNEHGLDSHNLGQLQKKIQFLIREYSRLVQDSVDYANHIDEYFKTYFSDTSEYIIRLSIIKYELSNSINNI